MKYNTYKVYSQRILDASEFTDEEIFKELACKLIHDMTFEDFSKIFNCSKNTKDSMFFRLDRDKNKDIHYEINLEFNIL